MADRPSDPDEIWLQPACCADPEYGRLWAPDDPFEHAPECEERLPAIHYVARGRWCQEALVSEAQRLLRRYSTSQEGWRALAEQLLDYLGEPYESRPDPEDAK